MFYSGLPRDAAAPIGSLCNIDPLSGFGIDEARQNAEHEAPVSPACPRFEF
jgi:hypothetical protein